MNKIIIYVVGLVLGVFLSVGSWGCQSKNNQAKLESQESAVSLDSISNSENIDTLLDPERKEYDPRLILPENEVWELVYDSPGRGECHNLDSYRANGIIVMTINCEADEKNNGIVEGTWYTRNDTLFLGPINAAPIKYGVTNTRLTFYEQGGTCTFQRVKQPK